MQSSINNGVNRCAPRSRRTLVITCLAFAAAEVLGVSLVYVAERSSLAAHQGDAVVVDCPEPNESVFVFRAPGIDRPATREADKARLSDEEPVLGVSVDGEFRAYRVEAMKARTDHIVNDVIHGHPISVTYCDIYDCACGFTGEPGNVPLRISQGGLYSGGMVIRVGDAEYSQTSGELVRPGKLVPPFPYSSFPLERMTWTQWRTLHPETTVYEGRSADALVGGGG